MADFQLDLNAMTVEQLQVLQQFNSSQLGQLRAQEPRTPTSIGAELVDYMPGYIMLLAIVTVFFFRFARRRETERTVRLAIERGQTLGPEVMEKLFPPPFRLNLPSMSSFLIVMGIVAISVGISCLGVSSIVRNDIEEWRAFGIVVGIIGAGFALSGLVIRKPAANF